MKANALYMLGCSQEKLDRYDQAIESFDKALILHKEQKGPDHIDVARSLRRLGVLYKLQKDHTKSKTSLMQSLRISSECLDPSHNEVSQVHEYLAETLCRDSQHRESLLHIGKAIENYEGHGKTLDLARCYGLHGTILDQAGGNLDEVINSHKKSKELFDELLRDTRCDAQNREDFMSFASNVFKLAMAQERSGKDKTATSNYACK
jgi:tetratricopeptide (TPR) repeat protein